MGIINRIKYGKNYKHKQRASTIKTRQGFDQDALNMLLYDSYHPSLHSDELLAKGFVEDEELSTKYARVYVNMLGNDTYVVHRGTDPTELGDLMTDVRMVFGDHTSQRWKSNEKTQRLAEQKYAGTDVITLGHSLGGSIALNVAKDKSKVIAVDPYVAPFSSHRFKGSRIMRNFLDPVSKFAGFGAEMSYENVLPNLKKMARDAYVIGNAILSEKPTPQATAAAIDLATVMLDTHKSWNGTVPV